MQGRIWITGMLLLTLSNLSAAGSVGGDADAIFLTGKWRDVSLFRFTGPGDVAVEAYGSGYVSASPLPDGQYSYEVWGYSNEPARVAPPVAAEHSAKAQMDNGRGGNATTVGRFEPEVKLEDGYFRIKNGKVFEDNGETER